jgi:ferredoxin-NADP reductase
MIWSSLGGLIIAGVLIQLGLITVENIRRVRGRSKQSALDFQLLETQLGMMRDLRRLRAERPQPWNGFRKFQVTKKVVECCDICSFYLTPHDRKPLPDFLPGQYLTFRLDIPGAEKSVIRCYSLSDASRPNEYRVTIKRLNDPQGVAPCGVASSFFHEQVEEGDILDVKAPSGNFFLDPNAGGGGVVLVGGGIGVTPVLSMLNRLVEQRVNREIWFFYGLRCRSDHAMKEHLEAVARENPNVRLHVCASNPDPDYRLGQDYHHTGRVSVDLFKELLPSNNYDFYVCGPGPMMHSVTEGLKEWGVPESKIHYETFGPSSVKKIATTASAEDAAKAKLSIQFKKSCKTAPWTGEQSNLLELAEAHGISIPSGCRAGSCGTCQIAIFSGEVAYLEKSDFETEPGTRLTCIGVPKSDLVVDA